MEIRNCKRISNELCMQVCTCRKEQLSQLLAAVKAAQSKAVTLGIDKARTYRHTTHIYNRHIK